MAALEDVLEYRYGKGVIGCRDLWIVAVPVLACRMLWQNYVLHWFTVLSSSQLQHNWPNLSCHGRLESWVWPPCTGKWASSWFCLQNGQVEQYLLEDGEKRGAVTWL